MWLVAVTAFDQEMSVDAQHWCIGLQVMSVMAKYKEEKMFPAEESTSRQQWEKLLMYVYECFPFCIPQVSLGHRQKCVEKMEEKILRVGSGKHTSAFTFGRSAEASWSTSGKDLLDEMKYNTQHYVIISASSPETEGKKCAPPHSLPCFCGGPEWTN